MKQGFGAAMERTEDLMNKSVSDWETLIDNFFNTSEKDALTDATKNGYLARISHRGVGGRPPFVAQT